MDRIGDRGPRADHRDTAYRYQSKYGQTVALRRGRQSARERSAIKENDVGTEKIRRMEYRNGVERLHVGDENFGETLQIVHGEVRNLDLAAPVGTAENDARSQTFDEPLFDLLHFNRLAGAA